MQRLSWNWIGFTVADVYPASECGPKYRRREPRWISACFFLIGSKAQAFGLAGPHIRFKKPRAVSLSPSPAKLLQYSGGCLLLSVDSCLPSDCRCRLSRAIIFFPRQDRPNDSGVFVGQCDCNDIWVPPFTHPLNPLASGIGLSTRFAKNGASTVDQQGAQVSVATFADPKQPGLPAA